MTPRPTPRPWLTAGLALGIAATVGLARPARGQTPSGGRGDVAGQLNFGGRVRTYLVHRPPGFRAGLPVVLAFHGGGGTAAGMARISGLDAVADRHGFVV
ncbi:MAG TPA: hypothetical protein VGU73_04985, partial [Acidimicrobiia bacterium]|nr:hypothetical protein [Acidimicrobiia bacterium]